jgi:hypothetical protein
MWPFELILASTSHSDVFAGETATYDQQSKHVDKSRTQAVE